MASSREIEITVFDIKHNLFIEYFEIFLVMRDEYDPVNSKAIK
jgi:hypothetical protein